MSRYRKGFGGLWIIIVVTFFILVSMHILVRMHFVTKVVKVQGEVDIYLDIDDKGTESLSFLSVRSTKKDYMEILGSLVAKDSDNILRGGLSRIESSLDKMGNYYLIVKDSSGNVIYEKKRGDPSQAAKVYELGGINIQWPVREKPVISSGFGIRRLNNRPDFHGGIDIALPEGTEVYPAADGQIVEIGRDCEAAPDACQIVDPGPPRRYNHDQCGCNGGLGNYVTIKHYQSGKTFYTFYDHLQNVPTDLKEGDKVTTNTLVGFIGNTGYSTGAHLHFELGTKEKKSDATAVDPCPYLPDAPLECEQASHRVRGYDIDIPLPGGKRGKVEMVIW
ncbi:MAG: peptidoglycan DD-metalloendopeptidase family protein [Candidatus Aenigmarchaeota archaeon]|nr:peptidoglycan DD-metalloendopeptidase family protein [Candidatus Aenigmarchaeota archaeon]